jgi:replicative DNA helicase
MMDKFDKFINAMAESLKNDEAEQALIGTVLLGGPEGALAWGKAAGRVSAEDFSIPVHGLLWSAIAARMERAERVDALVLGDLADDLADLRPLGGRAYLAGLVASVLGPSGAADYADTVRDLARRRSGLAVAAEFSRRALDHAAPLDETVSQLSTEANGLLSGGRSRSRSEVLAAVIAEMRCPPPCYSTGLPALDHAMGGGLFAGRVYGVAGLGKSGKSMLAGTISENLNAGGVRHAYLALEMGSREIERRKLARRLAVPALSMVGAVRPDLLDRVGAYVATAPDYTVYADIPGATFDELRSEVLAARHRHRVTGIIVDYWQLVTGRERGVTEEEHLRRVAQWLAAAASRLGVWVLVLAQLADDGEATAVSRTGLNRASDQLYFLRREHGSPWAWMEQRFSRYTPPADVGSKEEPALRLRMPGPWFSDVSLPSDEEVAA